MVHPPSRRDLLRSGAALTALTGLAGCSDLLNTLGTDGSTGALAGVPDNVSVVATVDAAAVRDDDATKTLVNAWFEGRAEHDYVSDEQPENYAEMRDQFEEEFDLDATAVTSITPFFDWSGFYGFGSRGFGTLVNADWTTEDIAASLEDSSGQSYEEDEHYGKTIYQPESDDYYSYGVWLGVLADGEFVVGAEGAVRETIEVRTGAIESLDGRLQEAYTATRDAPIRFVFDLPLGLIPDEIEREGTTVHLEPLNEVAAVAGAVYEAGENRGIEVTMTADDDDTAKNLTDTVEGYLAFVQPEIDREELATALDEVSASRDGSKVILRYEKPVADLADAVRALAGPSDGDDRRGRMPPTAAFSFDYSEREGTVEITHDGGDSIRVRALSIRGTGFADATGADMTGPGQWRGSSSGEIDDELAVVAGDRVVVGVAPDCDIVVVWESLDGESSATLAKYEGPDA